MRTVATLVGSLRQQSINRRLASALERIAGSRMAFQYIDVGSLPLYNDDLWADPPRSVRELKEKVEAADAVLFVTPEYNRSIPGVLKNAIDWGSRPKAENSWAGKPVAIAGTSVGAIGTAVAQSHLRGILGVLDGIVMGQPELQLAWREGSIGDEGQIEDGSLEAFLSLFIDRFDAWIGRLTA